MYIVTLGMTRTLFDVINDLENSINHQPFPGAVI